MKLRISSSGPLAMEGARLGILLAALGWAADTLRCADAQAPAAPQPLLRRIGAAQPRSRLIDYRLSIPADVLDKVDRSLAELEELVHKAGTAKCDVLALPEDTLGLGHWEAAHKAELREVLPEAVKRMLSRLGRAAAEHRMYLVCCNDTFEADGSIQNTAFFLGRDGRELGRYHKVNMPIHELDRKRGGEFPVFSTPDLGGVGLLICYDMVFPEAPRCLALGGADIIFHPTLGGAAIGDDDISRAAFRTRAVENFVYVVVAQRGSGSMIISPQGKVLAEGNGPDEIVIADVDPFGGREGGDSMNWQTDMRARLFRERSPTAYSILTATNPPGLAHAPETMTVAEAVRVSSKALTAGEGDFRAAAALVNEGKTERAVDAFQRLIREYRGTWIDRVSRQRLAALGVSDIDIGIGADASKTAASSGAGLAAKHPGDEGLAQDPRVLFAENFETGTLEEIGRRWGQISNKDNEVMAFSGDTPPGTLGKRSLLMTATLGRNTGGHLYTRLARGADKVFARFYVKFPADAAYIHHFVTLGGYNPPTPWPQGGAGERPRGDDRFTVGIEPYGNYGRFPAPGAWNFYTYWQDMKGSADGKYWGNSLTPVQPALTPRDRWQCVELMIQCNSSPEKADGELALWLDGQPVAHFRPGVQRGKWTGMGFSLLEQGGEPMEGFRWRSNPDLKVNFFWLMLYVTENAARQNRVANPNPVNRVWFDDIVLATEYIGPMAPKAR
jgi:predicted amidohydrolase